MIVKKIRLNGKEYWDATPETGFAKGGHILFFEKPTGGDDQTPPTGREAGAYFEEGSLMGFGEEKNDLVLTDHGKVVLGKVSEIEVIEG